MTITLAKFKWLYFWFVRSDWGYLNSVLIMTRNGEGLFVRLVISTHWQIYEYQDDDAYEHVKFGVAPLMNKSTVDPIVHNEITYRRIWAPLNNMRRPASAA